MAVSDLDIANMALRMLGESPITQGQFNNPQQRTEKLIVQFFETTRVATLELHHWNFAMKRAHLLSYTLPSWLLTPTATSGTGVQFDGPPALPPGVGFAAADVGKVIANLGGSGRATITTIISQGVVLADITTPWPSLTTMPAGGWKLYNIPPVYEYQYKAELPSDTVRLWVVDPDQPFLQEGTQLLWGRTATWMNNLQPIWEWWDYTIQDTLDIQYVSLVTNPALYPSPFILTFASHLALIVSENITGQMNKSKEFETIFNRRLASAMANDNLVGTSPYDMRSQIVTNR